MQQQVTMNYRLTGNVANDARWFRVWGRSYSGSNEVKTGVTYYWDGRTSQQTAETQAFAIEYLDQSVIS